MMTVQDFKAPPCEPRRSILADGTTHSDFRPLNYGTKPDLKTIEGRAALFSLLNSRGFAPAADVDIQEDIVAFMKKLVIELNEETEELIAFCAARQVIAA